jgi:hypothetical protein
MRNVHHSAVSRFAGAAGDPTRRLEIATFAYLGLPVAVFLAGWLRPLLAIVLLMLVAGCLIADWRSTAARVPGGAIENATPRSPRRLWVMALLVSFLWASVSGMGGHGAQSGDYEKHNAVLHDLVTHSWPVVYQERAAPEAESVCTLVYYVAFYLPAAAIGKAWGWAAANHALFFWGWFGIALSLVWFSTLLKARSTGWMLLFPFAGGLDHLGHYLVHRTFMPFSQIPEWWVGPLVLQYSSASSLLLWVPQHALPGWLLTALLLHRRRRGRTLRGSLLLLAGGALWSPFVVVGLAPLAAAAALPRLWRTLRSWTDLLAAPALGGVLALYYLSSRAEIGHGWIWELVDRPDLWLRLCAFLTIEVGIYLALLGRRTPLEGPGTAAVWGAALLSLAFLPLYRVGYWGDLTMRSSIPALFLLWIAVVDGLADSPPAPLRPLRRLALGVAFAIGSLGAVSELSRPLTQDLSPRTPPGVTETSVVHLPDWAQKHFWSDPDSVFFEYLTSRRR